MTLLSSGDLLVAREWALSIHYPLIGPLQSIPLLYNGSQTLPDSVYSSLNWSHFEVAFLLHFPPVLFLLNAVTNLPIFVTQTTFIPDFTSNLLVFSVLLLTPARLSALSPLPSPATVFPLAASPTVPCFHPLESFPPLDLSPETSHLHALQKSLPLPRLSTPLSCLHPWEPKV